MKRNARAVLVILAVLVMGGASPRVYPHVAAQSNEGEVIGAMGDVTCDGGVTLADVITLRRTTAGTAPAPSCIAVAGDVTCDNAVDSVDVLRIMRYLAGFEDGASAPCEGAGEEIVRGPSSGDLIDAALAAEEITEDQAATYRVYAAYDPGQLPAQFSGDDRFETVSLDIAEVYANWASLSPATQQALIPYMMPPISDDSWYTGESSLRGMSDLVGHLVEITGTSGLKIWTSPNFPAGQLTEIQGVMSQLMTSTKNLMGRSPLDDSSIPAPNNGGDGALDVYVLPGLPLDAIAKWHEPNTCNGGSMFLEVAQELLPPNPGQTSSGFAAAIQKVSHAFVHATAGGVQTGSGCVFAPEFEWLVEATSALTEHIAFPDLNTEHIWDDVFEHGHVSLHELPEGGHSLWTLLANIQRTDPNVVSEIWAAAETSANGHLALSLATELEEAFPAYANELTSESPFDHFETSHGINLKLPANIGLQGSGIGNVLTIALDSQPMKQFTTALTSLDDFSVQHYRFILDDPAVKSVSFSNLVHGVAGTAFQLMTKENPTAAAQLVDVTNKALHNICLADLGSSISELTLVLSHFDVDNLTPAPYPDKPIVEARDSCGFTGTVTQTRHVTCVDPCGDPGVNVQYSMTASNLVFKRSETDVEDEEYYLLESGTIRWIVTGNTSENCTILGDDTVELEPGKGAIRIKHTESGVNYAMYGYFGNLQTPTPASEWQFVTDCGSGPVEHSVDTGIWMCSGGKQTSSNPDVLSGTYGLAYLETEPGISCPTSSGTVALTGEDTPGSVGPRVGHIDRSFSWNLQR